MGIAPKGHADYLELGSWNAICSVCGRKYKASEMVKLPAGVGGAWGGNTYVCRRDWRPRQTQDFVRGIPDKMAPEWTQQPVSLASVNIINDPEEEVEVDVCTYPSVETIINVREYIPILTIPLGTGVEARVVINAYAGVGLIETTSSADPCLPASLNLDLNFSIGIGLSFLVQPSAAGVDEELTPAVQVALTDFAGQVITDFTGEITLTLGENPGGAVLSGTLVQSAVAGVATFDDLSLDATGVGYTLVASFATDYQSAIQESAAFDIVFPQLTFTAEPQDGVSNITLETIEVSAVSVHGSVDTSFTGNVTLAFGDNPGGATLYGTLTVAAVAGVATFESVKVDGTGSGFTLVATATDTLEGESTDFSVALAAFTQDLLYTSAYDYTYDNPLEGAFMYFHVMNASATVGPTSDTLDIFDFSLQNSPITVESFGDFRTLKGVIYVEDLPPGYALLAGANNATIYRVPFDGGVESISVSLADPRSMIGPQMEDNVGAIFAPVQVGGTTGRPLFQWTNLNWGAGTSTQNSDFGSLAAANFFQKLFYNGTAIDSRVYTIYSVNSGGSAAAPHSIGWVHSGTGALTNVASFANLPTCGLLARRPGDTDSDARLYNMSGNAAEANVVQKRDTGGVLLDTVTLSGPLGIDTDFDTFFGMVFDYVNNHLWVQAQNTSGRPIWVIDCDLMEVIATGTPTGNVEIVQPLGHPTGGVLGLTVGSNKVYHFTI